MLALSICVWYASGLVVLSILLMMLLKRNYHGLLMTLIGLTVTLLVVWGILSLVM